MVERIRACYNTYAMWDDEFFYVGKSEETPQVGRLFDRKKCINAIIYRMSKLREAVGRFPQCGIDVKK